MGRPRILQIALMVLVVGPAAAVAQEDEVTPLPPVIVEEVPAATPTPEPSPAAAPTSESPSAEMIIDAEEEVLEEPATSSGARTCSCLRCRTFPKRRP